jgi:hypothetical protein
MNERDAPEWTHTNDRQNRTGQNPTGQNPTGQNPAGQDPTGQNPTGQDPTGQDPIDQDHWEMFAEAMDLTIEGHRLIAEEIIFEVKLAWRTAVSWLRGLAGMTTSPPV